MPAPSHLPRRAVAASRLGLAFACAVTLAGGAARADNAAAADRDVYQVVILRRGPRAAEFTKEQLQRMEAAHQAHLQQLMESGKLVAVGPFADQADPTYRGMCLYRAASVDEARRLAEADPAVVAGRVRVEVMTWKTVKGWLAFPLHPNAPAPGGGGPARHEPSARAVHGAARIQRIQRRDGIDLRTNQPVSLTSLPAP